MVMQILHTALAVAIFHGAISGMTPAVEADWQAFQTWKSFSDFRTYNWKLAVWNWGKGAVIGAVTNVVASGGLAALTAVVIWGWRG